MVADGVKNILYLHRIVALKAGTDWKGWVADGALLQ